MKISGLLNSFRARLLLLLAVMLGLTLGVQYYVNLRAIKSNAQVIVEQEQAIMTGVALLQSNPKPSEEEIRHALEGNLCRCTGYQNIVRSIQYAADKMSGAAAAD